MQGERRSTIPECWGLPAPSRFPACITLITGMHLSPLMRLASSWELPWRPISSRSSGRIYCENYRESISANPSLLAGRLGDAAFAGEV